MNLARHETDRPRSVPAALLSALIPGAGQWYAGRRIRALLFFAPLAVVAIGSLILALQGRAYLASLTVRPAWLWAFLAVNVSMLVIRAASSIDAYLLGRRAVVRPWTGPVVLGVVLLLIAAPHWAAATRNLTWLDTLETVFDAEPRAPVTDPNVFAGPELSTTLPQTTTTTTEARQVGVPSVDLPTATVPVQEFLPLEGLTDGRYLSVLLAGGDAGPGRGGLRTDTMIVATLDLEENRASLFGVSRELVEIPLPGGFAGAFESLENELWEWELREWMRDQPKKCRRAGQWKEDPPEDCPPLPTQPPRCRCFPDRINAIYTYTRNWTRTFPEAPDPGMEALRQAMEVLIGIPIDYYVLVDMGGFVSLVDALGGVDIMVTESIHEGFSPAREGEEIVRVDVEPGMNHLDGHEALAYVRSRTNTSDAQRITRQRCMVRSVAAAADPLNVLINFNEIAAAVRDHTSTNIPLDFLPELVRVGTALDMDDIATAALTGPGFYSGTDFRGIPTPRTSAIRQKVKDVLERTDPGDAAGDEGECG